MRIVALVKDHEHVCCRYRLAAYSQRFAAAGHDLVLQRWPPSFLSPFMLRRYLRGADVLIVQRRLPDDWQLALFRDVVKCTIYDVDDAVFLRDSFSSRGLHCADRAERFRTTVQGVDHVVVGSPFLHESASLWAHPDRVHLIPTCVDVTRYPMARHTAGSDALKLVWIGSSSTLRGLKLIQPILEQVGRTCRGLTLKIICDRFFELKNLPVQKCVWSETTEATELAAADVGISWLPDDLWSQGKCGLKVLQYMAAGLPVIANPVGLHRDLVRDGETGFLVSNAAEIIRAIRRLGENPQLRIQMGAAGRRRVEKDFQVSRGAEHWLGLLATVGQQSPRNAQVAGGSHLRKGM